MDNVVMAIIEKEGKYLLVSLNKHLEKYGGLYCPVGGHVEKDETKEEALIREVKEELGISVFDLKFVTSSSGSIPNKLLYWYSCKTKDSISKFDTREIKDANFFTKNQILKMKLWPDVLEIFQKHIF